MPETIYVRIYADETGESHFEDVSIQIEPSNFAPPAPPIQVAPPFETERAIIGVGQAGWYGDWHPSPARQFWIALSGTLSVTTSDGETRTFGPGSIVLLDDTWGRGHQSRVVGNAPVSMVFVQLK